MNADPDPEEEKTNADPDPQAWPQFPLTFVVALPGDADRGLGCAERGAR